MNCPACGGQSVATGIRLGGYELHACAECGMRYAPGAFGTPGDYEAIYETDEYRNDQIDGLPREKGQAEKLALCATYRPFFRRVGRGRGRTLLDVGCGVGRFCHAARAYGWNVRGIDVSRRAIETATVHADFPVECVGLEEVVRRGDRYEAATAFEVIEHLPDPVEFLRRCREVLVPGGEMICTAPNWNCAAVQAAERPDWLPPIHLCFHVGRSLEAAARRAGFGEIRTGTIWDDACPEGWKARARWAIRRLGGKRRQPLGLWLHARV